MTTRELLVAAWDPGPAVLLVSLGALSVYGARFRQRLSRRAVWFVAAVLIFFLAIASPIGVLARGYLFSAHMLQHLLLLLAVPPLVLLGLPRVAATNGSEPAARSRSAVDYAVPWLAGVGAMWIWHERALCNAAAASSAVQWFQTTSLLVMGLAFWRPVVSPRVPDRFTPFVAILYLFTACVACTVLGILVTFSPVEVCTIYMHPVDRLGALPLLRDGWGMTSGVDQQIGGLMMWIPACLVYGAAILAMLARYYREDGLAPQPTGQRKAAMEAK